MLTEQTGALTDPVARLLEFYRGLERAVTFLETGGPEHTQAVRFLDTEAPLYRQDLEQALFPLLKRRLRNDDDEAEEELRREVFLAEGELARLAADWPALRPGGPEERQPPYADSLQGWREHIERMEGVILPAIHARLSACDLMVLGRAMAQHRGLPWQDVLTCETAE